MTAPHPSDHDRAADALNEAYALLRTIGRRHREQVAAADSEHHGPEQNDEPPADERAA